MAERAKNRRLRTIATVGVLVPVVAVVVYSSFYVNEFECEVCIRFEGREACRTVGGKTEEEARRAAVDNTCAQLSSGVTDSLRCSRTEPSRVRCRAVADG